MGRQFIIFAALLLASGLAPATLSAAIIVVDGAGGGDVLTIQQGIDEAADGDLVLVRPGVYAGPGNIGLDYAGKAITVASEAGTASTFIHCGGTDRALHFHSGEGPDSVFRGFSISEGSALFGGAIFCQGASPTITDCLISGCQAFNAGGAICGSASSAVIRRVSITDCATSPFGDGGGIALGDSDVELTEVTIDGCTAFHGGGGLYASASSPVLERCEMTNNTAHGNGGGLHLTEGSSPLVQDCTISGNTADDDGGGVYCHNDSSPQVLGCRITGNPTGRYGGGVYCDQGSAPLVRGNAISDNSAYAGGGVYCYTLSAPRIISNLIRGNETVQGGGGVACFRADRALVSGNRIEENIASDAGGMGIDFCSPTVTDNIIRGNTTEWSAAGMLITRESDPVVVNNLIVGNHATYSAGGLYVTRESNPVLANLTVAENTAVEEGGGCYFARAPGMAVPLENCIIYGNRSLEGGDQLYVSGNGRVVISHTDLQGGQPGIGGGGDVIWGFGNIDSDPLWVSASDEYYLARTAAGHPQDSPCIDSGGSPAADVCTIGPGGPVCLDARTTDVEGLFDEGLVDMGFHYRDRAAAVDCSLSCTPGSAAPPFSWRIAVGLRNLRTTPRRIAGRADLELPDGSSWPGWRSGFYNMPGAASEYVSWTTGVPALPSLLGRIRLELTVTDITPPPWNQPPYAPAGHSAAASCTVDVIPPSTVRR